MRNGEIITAGVLALLSIYMMYEASKNGIGYVQGTGPAGGFWPFWLSVGMLISTGVVALNWVRRASPASRSEEPVLDAYGRRMLVLVGGGIIGFVALISIISMYGAIAVFLVYYLRFLGRHGWGLTLTLATIMPIGLFFFFEGLMRISMPKGLEFTEPFFNVLYDVIY
jgi:putative tricarboxylic transport membrane protein